MYKTHLAQEVGAEFAYNPRMIYFGLFERQFFRFITHYKFIYASDKKKTEQNDFIEWKRSNVHDRDKYDDFRVVGEFK